MRKLGAATLSVPASLLLIAILLSGCVSPDAPTCISNLSRQELKSEVVAIAAITRNGGEALQADALAKQIESRFRKARPWLHLLPLASVRTNFSATEYQQTLQNIGEREDWSPVWLEDFNRLTNHARFVLLTHLHTRTEIMMRAPGDDLFSLVFDALWSSLVHKISSDDDEEEEEEEEEAEPVPYRERTLRMRMGIYDLHARRIVWLATGSFAADSERVPEGDSGRAEDNDKPINSRDFERALRWLSGYLPK